MADVNDLDLIREYADNLSESAFVGLVQRHINFVYSAALRYVGNAEDARDVTQAVFIILARKITSLRQRATLTGWLYETTRFTARQFLRTSTRRQAREQEAYMESIAQPLDTDALWKQLAPVLEDAMARLSEQDRALLALRFFENKSIAETASLLGLKEWAVRKRAERSVEKLRAIFHRRGIAAPGSALTSAISAHSIHIAPDGLANAISAVAMAKSAAASTSTLTLVKGALKLMAWTKVKTAIAAGVIVLLAVRATTSLTVKEIQSHKKYRWEVPQASFGVFYKMPATVKIVPTKYSKDGGACCDGTRGAMGIAQPLKNIIEVAWQQDSLHTVVETDLPSKRYDFFAKLVGPLDRHHYDMNTNWDTALQQEIIREFGVKGDRQMRNADVLVLRPFSTGPKNFKVSHSMPHGLAVKPGPGSFSAYEQPISTMTGMLQQFFKTPIVDETGLTEEYDYSFHWKQTGPDQPDLDSLKLALQDQLGLELVPTNIPIQMLVIEKAD